MMITPPPVDAPWTVDPKTGKLNSPPWLLWLNSLVSAVQLADEFSATQIYQSASATSSESSSRGDEVITQDDLANIIVGALVPMGEQTSRGQGEPSLEFIETPPSASTRNPQNDLEILIEMSM